MPRLKIRRINRLLRKLELKKNGSTTFNCLVSNKNLFISNKKLKNYIIIADKVLHFNVISRSESIN